MKNILLPTFDFDGNVIAPKTLIFLYDTKQCKVVQVSATDFEEKKEIYMGSGRYTHRQGDGELTFSRFRDFSPVLDHPGPDGLIKDTKQALKEGLFSPSFPYFKRLALIEANLFAILTARGHGADNIQRAIEMISQEALSSDEKKDQQEHIQEKYFDILNTYNISKKNSVKRFFDEIPSYIGVHNKNFCKMHGIERRKDSARKKVEAIAIHYARAHSFYDTYQQFQEAQQGKKREGQYRFAKGFSDDSGENILAMNDFFYQKAQESVDKYRLYFTGSKEKREELQKQIIQKNGAGNSDIQEYDTIMKIRLYPQHR